MMKELLSFGAGLLAAKLLSEIPPSPGNGGPEPSIHDIKLGILPDPCSIGDGTTYIAKCREYTNIDVWKVLIAWSYIEPTEGNFNSTYMNAIKSILDAANTDGKKVQLSFNQAFWPSWTGCTSNSCGGTYPRFTNSTLNNRLKNVWIYLVNQLKNYPALESYLIIAEDGALQKGINIDNYISANNTIISAIRQIDSTHKITTRTLCTGASNYTYLRYRIASGGLQDIDYGITNYAVGSSASCGHTENPISVTSCFMTDINIREPYIYATSSHINSLGEIGYWKGTINTWGDAERLKALRRSLAIAHELGCKEFMMWSCGGGKPGIFANPTTYFPQLKTFRDTLASRPRLTIYNVRVLVDNTTWLNVGWYPTCSAPTIPSNQPYMHLMKTLDERGASWFFVHPYTAQYIPNYKYDRTIRTSEIYGKTTSEQTTLINNRLSNVILNGNYYPWSGTNAGDVVLR